MHLSKHYKHYIMHNETFKMVPINMCNLYVLVYQLKTNLMKNWCLHGLQTNGYYVGRCQNHSGVVFIRFQRPKLIMVSYSVLFKKTCLPVS